MRILVLGESKAQLDVWRDRNFAQGDIYLATRGVLRRGQDDYVLFVARRHDERVCGMEFGEIVILPGAIDFGGQYSMRVR